MRFRRSPVSTLAVTLALLASPSAVHAEESEPTEPTAEDLARAERAEEPVDAAREPEAPIVNPSGAGAVSASNEASAPGVEMRTLSTGLRVVLEPTVGAAEATVCTAFDAGVRADPPDRPGVARLLAEVMKDGGYRSSSQDYTALLAERGGQNRLVFDHESVVFCTTVPSKEVPLALWVASGRFTVRALTEEELKSAAERLTLEAEARDVDVRRGVGPERLRRMAFSGTPTYGRARLPDELEIAAVQLADLRALHHAAYGSKRAVVALSGGFDPEKIQPWLDEHLGHVREGDAPTISEASWFRQTTERFSMAEDASAKTPAAWYGWVLPSGPDREALRTGLAVLTDPSGRLAKKLSSAGQLGSELGLSFDAGTGPGLARIDVVGRGSQSLGTIEKELDAEIRRLSEEGPTAAELAEARARLAEARARDLLTPSDRARELSRGVLFGRTPADVLAPLDAPSERSLVEPGEVRAAMAAHLGKKSRSVVEIYPKGWKDPWQAPMPLFHVVSPGESLLAIARDYRTTVAALVKMNSGLDPKKPIHPGEKLRVPRSPKGAEPEPILHKVKRGETLGGLALRYGITVRDIADANGLNPKQPIRSGAELRIPRVKKGDKPSAESSKSGAAKPAAVGRTHQVRGGETWLGIAKKYGVTSAELARANGKTPRALLSLGQVLRIPEAHVADEKPAATSSAKPDDSSEKGASEKPTKAAVTHKVKSGETLSEIARRFGVTVAALSRENGLTRKSTLRVGQVLVIPKD